MDEAELELLLARCDTEPIHAPGAVQPHGALLVVDASGTIVAASENATGLSGVAASQLLGSTPASSLPADLRSAVEEALVTGRSALGDEGDRTEVTIVRAGDLAFVELEPDHGGGDDGWRLQQIVESFLGAPTIDALAEQLVQVVAELTGFDRVMCYRFDPEWNGEVIAEHVALGIESFDGLRFPASDIPAQARAQYARTPLRLIPDVAAVPSPLLTLPGLAPATLDLSDAKLRAVSPIHLRYLQNMGVHSSMSVSLTVDGRLWGIVACHHLAAPLRPSLQARRATELVARTSSLLLTVLQANQATAARLELLQQLEELGASLAHAGEHAPIDVLAVHGERVLKLLGASGVVVVGADGRRRMGVVPSDDVTDALLERCRSTSRTVVSDELGAIEPAWADLAEAAGALAVLEGPGSRRGIVWYRPEEIRTVRWAGDPTAKPLGSDAGGMARLDPRTSFATYAQEVRGRSAGWTPQEAEAAGDLADRLADAESLRAEREAQLAAHLQQTLLLESFPEIAGVVGAAEYRPVSNSPLGGDWYDVFYLPSGRSILAVGDVAGHGLEVAGAMAQLRHALRAYLVRAPTAAEALARLNHLTIALLPKQMATVVLVELDLPAGVVRIVNAGHPPPLILGGAGGAYVIDNGPALGIHPSASYGTAEVPVHPGDRIVLYSDGLIERRTRPIDDGLNALEQAVNASRGAPVDEQARLLADRLTGGTDVDDDVTVVIAELLAAADAAAPHG